MSPRDRPIGKALPALKLQQKVCSKHEKRRFYFEKAGHCKKVYRLFKIHRNTLAKIVPAHHQVRLSLKREVL